jgi:hypothetical protein
VLGPRVNHYMPAFIRLILCTQHTRLLECCIS